MTIPTGPIAITSMRILHRRAWLSIELENGSFIESSQFEQGEITRIIPRIGETYKHGDDLYIVVDVIHSVRDSGDLYGSFVQVILRAK